MKKAIIVVLMLSFGLTQAFSQTAKKYVTIEHFTNTYCGICSSKNPPLAALVANNHGDVHHISYHPNVPYPQCSYYQHNPADNTARKTYYSVNGSPRVVQNGTYTSFQTPLLSQAHLDTAFNQSSPLRIQVEETTGMTRDVTVKVKTYEPITNPNLRLFVAVAEKYTDFNSPNGETEHHNVMRDFLSSNAGDAFAAAAVGEELTFNYSYTIDPAWVADEMYVIAFVQDFSAKTMINSGTKYDIIMDANVTHAGGANTGSIDLTVSGGVPPYTYTWSNGANTADLSNLTPGVYEVLITDATNQTFANSIEILDLVVPVKINVLLEAPYDVNTGLMSVKLQELNLLPTTQPFNRAPWWYEGSESVTTIPANASDWVLVELREVSNYNLVAAKAAFLLNDGTVADIDGTPDAVNFFGIQPSTAYHIVVRSRHHLANMSSDAIVVPNATSYDFTQGQILGGAIQMKEIAAGVFAQYAGDFDSNGVITVSDFNAYTTETGVINDYLDGDCNLDRTVTVADFNFFQPNTSVIGVDAIRY